VGEALTAAKRSRCWRWLVAAVAGFFMLWAVSLVLNSNLGVTKSWKTYYGPGSLAERSEMTSHSYTYRVFFCDLELARDDNLDGRDIRETIKQLDDMCDWIQLIVSWVSGLLVGFTVNTMLRLTCQSRSGDRE
jgi:hypothetical protein